MWVNNFVDLTVGRGSGNFEIRALQIDPVPLWCPLWNPFVPMFSLVHTTVSSRWNIPGPTSHDDYAIFSMAGF